jgi:glutamate-5-semialdehyde dehydrogenase
VIIKNIAAVMNHIGQLARSSAKELAQCSDQSKNQAIELIASGLRENSEIILEANKLDMDKAKDRNLSESMIDRLMLDETRINAMIQSLHEIVRIKDPINQVQAEWERPNGLRIQRVTVPLGVIGIIYESRPNVTADAAALCIKSGNTVILRGGSESFESNKAIYNCMIEAIDRAGLDSNIVQLVPTVDRDAVGYMLSSMQQYLDVIVPRGGKSLVKRVQKEARIPVIGHLEGICHIYIHKTANLEMARKITLNAKMRRTGICGAAETILIDRDISSSILNDLINDLDDLNCEIRGDEEVQKYSEKVIATNEDDWSKEYLDAIISCKVVDNIHEAIAHIEYYGSGHTDSIIAEDKDTVDIFMRAIDSAIVMHNTSTQFADGGEFGMGAEIGIATGKIHARGPVGAMQLTSYKYNIFGDGQVRA